MAFDTQSFAFLDQGSLPTIGPASYSDDVPLMVIDHTGSYLFVTEQSVSGPDAPGQLAVVTTGTGTLMPASILPIIYTATETINGMVGAPFSYQIAADGTPTSYDATYLPPGLTVNTATGLISGTPNVASDEAVLLRATNVSGTATTYIEFVIGYSSTAAPTFTTGSLPDGTAFYSYFATVSAAGNPTSYGATGLPAGLGINSSTGFISGHPQQSGTFSVTLSATNANGTTFLTLPLQIAPDETAALEITSSQTVSGAISVPFTYQITPNGTPTSYAGYSLPAGLTVNTVTGLISGAPTSVGTDNFTVTAYAPGYVASALVTLTIDPYLPTIDVVATVPRVTAGSGDHGVVTFSRTGDLTQKLLVMYSIKGSAGNDTDDVTLTGKVKIKPNKASATVQIIPLGDPSGEGTRVVKLTVLPEAAYLVGSANKAKVKIVPGG